MGAELKCTSMNGAVLPPPARLDSPLAPGGYLGILFPARPFKLLLIGVKDAGALSP